MSEQATRLPEQSAPVRILVPPRHRLFAAFDDAEGAESAIDTLRSEGLEAEQDIWVFRGEEGARSLDPTGGGHGAWGRVVRFVELAMANEDVGYLNELSRELDEGHVVLAARVHSEHDADAMAAKLRAHGGHSFAYGAHWDFVPVVLGEPSEPAA